MYIPDNESIREYMVDEEERLERLHKRFEREENPEYEIPFVTVPDDYGKHQELYGGSYGK